MWFVYNWITFGSPVPQAVPGYRTFGPLGMGFDPAHIPFAYYSLSVWQAIKLITFVSPFSEFIRLVSGHRIGDHVVALTAVAVALVAGFVIRKRWKSLLGQDKARLGMFCRIFMPYAIIMLLAYSLYVLGMIYYPRYFAPLLAGMIIIALVMFGKPFVEGRFLKLKYTGIAAAFIFMALIYVTPYPQFGYPFPRVAERINEIVKPGERIGVFQAGMISYFVHNPSINLDGKLNNTVIPYLKEQRLAEYLKQENIKYIGDRKQLLKMMFWPTLDHGKEVGKFDLLFSEGDYDFYRVSF